MKSTHKMEVQIFISLILVSIFQIVLIMLLAEIQFFARSNPSTLPSDKYKTAPETLFLEDDNYSRNEMVKLIIVVFAQAVLMQLIGTYGW